MDSACMKGRHHSRDGLVVGREPSHFHVLWHFPSYAIALEFTDRMASPVSFASVFFSSSRIF